MIRITRCRNCGYQALNMVELEECPKCHGRLEIIVSEVLEEVKNE